MDRVGSALRRRHRRRYDGLLLSRARASRVASFARFLALTPTVHPSDYIPRPSSPHQSTSSFLPPAQMVTDARAQIHAGSTDDFWTSSGRFDGLRFLFLRVLFAYPLFCRIEGERSLMGKLCPEEFHGDPRCSLPFSDSANFCFTSLQGERPFQGLF